MIRVCLFTDSSTDDGDERARSASRHRKLPMIPSTSTRQRMYTPTYKYAINWLNKHKDTLDLALDLLEIHPSLINDESCNKLRQFIQRQSGSNEVKLDIDQNLELKTAVPLPEILVSHVQDELLVKQKPVSSGRGKICVCGDVEAEKWQRLLVRLCCKYTVTCSPVDSNQSEDHADCEVFLFLLDSKSFASDCCHQALRQAYSANLAVVFVRDMEFELYGTNGMTSQKFCSLNESADMINFESYLKAQDLSSLSCLRATSPTSYLRKTVNFHGSARNLSSVRTISRSTDSGIGGSGCSSRNSFSSSKSPNLLDIDESRFPFGTDNQRTIMTDDDRIKISKIINAEYGMAVTYHSLYHDTCEQRITAVIDSRLPPRNQVLSDIPPTPSAVSSNTDLTIPSLSSSLSRTTVSSEQFVQPQHKVEFGRRRRSVTFLDDKSKLRRGSIPTETVFLLSDPLAEDSPVIVHWPKDYSKQSISNSSSIDSFGFQEVDLSKQVNELDLFTDSEYE